MSRAVLDDELKSKLNNCIEPIEFCDERGQTLGHFLPPTHYDQLVDAWLNAQFTTKEVEQLRQQSGGRSLEEIWKSLGRT